MYLGCCKRLWAVIFNTFAVHNLVNFERLGPPAGTTGWSSPSCQATSALKMRAMSNPRCGFASNQLKAAEEVADSKDDPSSTSGSQGCRPNLVDPRLLLTSCLAAGSLTKASWGTSFGWSQKAQDRAFGLNLARVHKTAAAESKIVVCVFVCLSTPGARCTQKSWLLTFVV